MRTAVLLSLLGLLLGGTCKDRPFPFDYVKYNRLFDPVEPKYLYINCRDVDDETAQFGDQSVSVLEIEVCPLDSKVMERFGESYKLSLLETLTVSFHTRASGKPFA